MTVEGFFYIKKIKRGRKEKKKQVNNLLGMGLHLGAVVSGVGFVQPGAQPHGDQEATHSREEHFSAVDPVVQKVIHGRSCTPTHLSLAQSVNYS
jgi:hypothetical protein